MAFYCLQAIKAVLCLTANIWFSMSLNSNQEEQQINKEHRGAADGDIDASI